MKIPKLSLTIALPAIALVLAFTFGGGPVFPHKINGTIIAVENMQHGTRIRIIYKEYAELNTHQSTSVTDGTTTVNPHDYLTGYGGKTPYGAISGHEKEYEEYLKQEENK